MVSCCSIIQYVPLLHHLPKLSTWESTKRQLSYDTFIDFLRGMILCYFLEIILLYLYIIARRTACSWFRPVRIFTWALFRTVKILKF